MRRTVVWLAVAAAMALGLSAKTVADDRALLIGISRYHDPRVTNLQGPVNDVELISRLLLEEYGFRREQIRTLTDQAATKDSILQQIRAWLVQGAGPGDRVVFFFAGHGTYIRDRSGDEADNRDEAILATDFSRESMAGGGVPAGMIIDDELSELFSEIRSRRVVLLFDSCYSGTITRDISTGSRQSRYFPIIEEEPPQGETDSLSIVDLSAGSARGGVAQNPWIVLSAANANEEAYENFFLDFNRRHGSFTYYLFRGLRGLADRNRDNSISYGEIHAYVARSVLERDERHPQLECPSGEVNSAFLWEGTPSPGPAPEPEPEPEPGPPEIPSFHRVLAVSAGAVTINAGAVDEIQAGCRFAVGSLSRPVAELEVSRAEETRSFCRVLSQRGQINVGDPVVETEHIYNLERPNVCLGVVLTDRSFRPDSSSMSELRNIRDRLASSTAIRLVGSAGQNADYLVGLIQDAGARGLQTAGLTFLITKGNGRFLNEVTLTQPYRYERVVEAVRNLALRDLLADLANPSPAFSVDIRLSESRYRGGEDLGFSVEASADCYLLVLNLSVNGDLHILFPNRRERDNLILGGRVYNLPDPQRGPILRIAPPFGRELIKVLAFRSRADYERLRIVLPPLASPTEVLSYGGSTDVDALGFLRNIFLAGGGSGALHRFIPLSRWAEATVEFVTVER